MNKGYSGIMSNSFESHNNLLTNIQNVIRDSGPFPLSTPSLNVAGRLRWHVLRIDLFYSWAPLPQTEHQTKNLSSNTCPSAATLSQGVERGRGGGGWKTQECSTPTLSQGVEGGGGRSVEDAGILHTNIGPGGRNMFAVS